MKKSKRKVKAGSKPRLSVVPQKSKTIRCACGDSCPKNCSCATCPLLGKTITVIGGLDRLENEYGGVVQKLGGTCQFHCGKLRSNCNRLRNMVQRSDLVVFITCINSHAAMSVVKKQCKKCSTNFRVLRQSGVNSLEEMLKQYAA